LATAARGTTTARDKTPAQTFALVFGIVYLAIGLIGFAVTGFNDFFGEVFNEKLIIFTINPAHNIVHILIGAAWLAASRRHDSAKSTNLIIGIAYLAVFLLGLLGVLKWLAIPDGFEADQWLHLVSGALSVYFGTAGAGDRGRATTTA
jgi:Domain of unknown function (DUF4383)